MHSLDFAATGAKVNEGISLSILGKTTVQLNYLLKECGITVSLKALVYGLTVFFINCQNTSSLTVSL